MTNRPRNCAFLVILFISLLASILLATLSNAKKGSSESEKRSLATLPHLSLNRTELSEFPKAFEQFFADHLGFRQQLVFLNNLIHVKLLSTSPIDKIVVGRDGWLFYADESAMTTAPLNLALLELWRNALEAKRDWLRAKGIDYVFMVAPEKHTVYPEFLPQRHRRVGKQSNLDLLINYLKTKSTIRVVDVRPRLTAAKAIAPLYYKTDTHWNRYGAAVAGEELLLRITERNTYVMPLAKPSRPAITSLIKGQDMAVMMLLENLMSDIEVEPEVHLKNARLSINNLVKPEGLILSVSVNSNKQLPKAVVFHDSYFKDISPHFIECFSEVVLVGGSNLQKFDPDLIDNTHPQVVVEEIVERYLTGAPHIPKLIKEWNQMNGRDTINKVMK